MEISANDAFQGIDGYVCPTMFTELCVEELCQCNDLTYEECICNFLTDFSRVVVASGAQVDNWRSPGACRKLKCKLL